MEKNTAPTGGLQPLLSVEEPASASMSRSPRSTAGGSIVTGLGLRIARRIKFAISDSDAWIAHQRWVSPGLSRSRVPAGLGAAVIAAAVCAAVGRTRARRTR